MLGVCNVHSAETPSRVKKEHCSQVPRPFGTSNFRKCPPYSHVVSAGSSEKQEKHLDRDFKLELG